MSLSSYHYGKMADLQRVTRAQVAEHNTNSSVWMCIENQVYDLTTFLDQHPGGSEVLLKLAGHDATEQYEDIGHSTDARLMKDKYLVAEIVDEEKMTYSNDGEELFEKETIEAENKSDSTTMDPMVFVAILAVVFAIIYYFLLY
uniref:Cytochrome b5 n=2 Tax=Brugia malayi TaxID=6279 RepID=A0A7I4KE15_BRUMA